MITPYTVNCKVFDSYYFPVINYPAYTFKTKKFTFVIEEQSNIFVFVFRSYYAFHYTHFENLVNSHGEMFVISLFIVTF